MGEASYIEKARKAHTLRQKGKDNVAIKKALGFNYAVDAAHAAGIGYEDDRCRSAALTPDEVKAVVNIGDAQLAALARGDGCSPKFKYINDWGMHHSLPTVVRRRLGTHRKGDDQHRPTGLGLVHAYHGGYVCLLPAGWALYHALKGTQA